MDTYDSSVRKQVRDGVAAKRRELKSLLASCDVDQVELRMDQDYIRPLTRFFRMRARRK